jgi:hypothetical protein
MNQIGESVRDFYRRQGADAERKRIIELLKPFAEHEDDCWCGEELDCYPDDCSAGVYQQVIERIKGENK